MLVPLPHLMLPVHDPHDDKTPPNFFFQPHSLQIIQLVEGHPPPPRRMSSILPSSSSASSPYSESDSCSSQSESICSSYCSSDMPPDDHQLYPYPFSISDETYSYRMKRVFAWRDHFSTDSESSSSESPSSPSSSSSSSPWDVSRSPAPRRKPASDLMEDDALSHTSRHSRHHTTAKRSNINSVPPYSCPACDTSFPTRKSFRHHGRNADANEACHAAVEYALE